MNNLKLASVALLLVASTGLVFGSMGFSSVTADRGVSVSVAADDDALVGYDTDGQVVTGDESLKLVTVANRLPSGATVTDVAIDTDTSEVRVGTPSKPTLAPGDAETLVADVECVPGATANVTVSVTVEGEGVTAAISGDTTTRSFEVSCADLETQEDDARFNGGGNFEFGATDAETVNVTYWTENKGNGGSSGSFTEHSSVEVDPAKKLNGQVDGGPKFVAVYVHESDTTYVHPGFDRANGTVDWSAGDAVAEDGRFDPNAD